MDNHGKRSLNATHTASCTANAFLDDCNRCSGQANDRTLHLRASARVLDGYDSKGLERDCVPFLVRRGWTGAVTSTDAASIFAAVRFGSAETATSTGAAPHTRCCPRPAALERSDRASAECGAAIGSSCGQAAICLTLTGIQAASAASIVHQQVTMARHDPDAGPSGKRPSSLFPFCCAAPRHTHLACRLRQRP